jgi:DUF1680 family protein
VFQSREGTPELNCCSVNSARGLGLLSEWAILRDSQGLILNWLGPGKMTTDLTDGRKVALQLTTDYPRGGKVEIQVSPSQAARFSLRLRIPNWSAKTEVKLNRETVENVKPGNYLVLDRAWKSGDTIELTLDFTLHYWVGERDCAGKVSIYRGPLLLTYDRRFNLMDPADIPTLDARGLEGKVTTWSGRHAPFLLVEFATESGRAIRLCDFASAGDGGTPYISWLRVKNVAPSPFRQTNPLRSGRALLP